MSVLLMERIYEGRAVEMGSGGMTYVPSSMMISSGI
jgi:hypothetical protein